MWKDQFETEFCDPLRRLMVSKDCSLISTHTEGLPLLSMGGRGNHMVKAMMGQQYTVHATDTSGMGGGMKKGAEGTTPEPSE
jgi:hypothetical protein